MRTHHEEHIATTSRLHDFVDITDDIQMILTGSGISGGQVTVLVRDNSCSLLINEKESGLFDDIKKAMDRLGSPGILVGSRSVVVPASEGKLKLGGWQRVLLMELGQDPGSRSIVVQIVGE
ncbi:MAG TPA: YjbQ family protein [Actinomycetota bacterium]|nr:YjbQ family protein [Actinomycetota bacterium]